MYVERERAERMVQRAMRHRDAVPAGGVDRTVRVDRAIRVDRRSRRQPYGRRGVRVLPRIRVVVVGHQLALAATQRAVEQRQRLLRRLEIRPTCGRHSSKTAWATLRTASWMSRSSLTAWTSATSQARRGETPLRTSAPM